MPTKKKTILLIEDDEFLAELYAAKLAIEGYKVYFANDGQRGLKLAKEKIPSLVLLDILLPKMDGFEVLEGMKKEPKTSRIPVILLTNLSQKSDIQKGFDLGADDFLIKAHFMPSEVVAKIKRLTE